MAGRRTRRKTAETAEAEKPKRRGRPENLKRPDPPKYGIEQLAEQLDMDKGKLRAKLRALGVAKEGMVYDFKNKSGLNAVAKKVKAA